MSVRARAHTHDMDSDYGDDITSMPAATASATVSALLHKQVANPP